ncbi:hypothetical protein [Vibrio owensii]|uniref:hypothetical protein n=1 Tax=Vibrio owensii TaxID=696485 RepID=UPI002FF40899
MEIIKANLNGNHYRYSVAHNKESKQYLIFLLGALRDTESVKNFSAHFAKQLNCITIGVPGTDHTEN